jgi:hypothetical protein
MPGRKVVYVGDPLGLGVGSDGLGDGSVVGLAGGDGSLEGDGEGSTLGSVLGDGPVVGSTDGEAGGLGSADGEGAVVGAVVGGTEGVAGALGWAEDPPPDTSRTVANAAPPRTTTAMATIPTIAHFDSGLPCRAFAIC